jgi:tripartite-type tricarboxylate transporter receptor subunit TctC
MKCMFWTLAILNAVFFGIGSSEAADARQDYPNKPVRIVVPWPPGGVADFLARTMGQKLSEPWHQPVIVDSRPGAGTNIGSDHVAKSPPDGYTLLLASSNNAVNKSLNAKLP